MTAALAAVLMAVAVALVLPFPVEVSARRPRGRPWRLAAGAVPLSLAMVATLGLQAVALAAVAGLAAAGGIDLFRRERHRRLAADRRRLVVQMSEALAGEVRAGRAPADALDRTAEQYPLLRESAETARLGGDVAAALRSAAALPGAEALRPISAAWRLSTTAGAGLADALDRSTAQARADLALSTVVAGELSSARATARMLAAMPFLVLSLGRGMGFDPWGFLFFSWPGVGCLAIGVVLALVGLRWVDLVGDRGMRP